VGSLGSLRETELLGQHARLHSSMSDSSLPAITYEPHPGRGFIRIRVRGRFGFDEARSAVGQVISINPNLNRLWDFRDADLTPWTADEMGAFNALVRKRDDAGRYARMGALVSREIEFGIGRMYAMMSEDSFSPEHAVFRDEAEAIEWISARAPAPTKRTEDTAG
jgi:hypothetical protein